MALLGLLIYSHTFKVSFLWDDWTVIVSNDAIKKWWDFQAIWGAFNTRFILGVTLALNYAIGKLDVTGYHVFNVAFHVFSAVLVYFLVRLTFQTPAMKTSPSARFADLAALFSALLFLVHPVQTTAVNYIWQRAAVLATFFYLGAVVFYVKARLTARKPYYAAAFFATVLGMFTKETTATIPIMLTIYEVLFFGPIKKETKLRFLTLLPFLLTLLIIPVTFMRSSAVTMDLMRPDAVRSQKLDKQASPAENLDITRWVGEETMPRKEYYLTQLHVVRTYLRLLFFPVNQNLDYDYPISHRFADLPTLLSGLLLGAILLFAFVVSKKDRLLAFGIFWFFIGLSVESLVVQKDVIFEHRLYLLTVGFAIFSPVAVCLALNHWKRALLVLCLVTAVFSIAAYRRNMVWQDPITLWKDVIKKSPNKPYGYNFAAMAYGDRRDYDEAIEHYKKAVEIKPDFDAAYVNLGTAYAAQGKHEDAIQSYEKSIQIDLDAPSTISAYNNLGIEFAALRQYDKTEEFFKKAIEKSAKIQVEVFDPYNNLAMMYMALGRYEEAMPLLQKVISIDPAYAKAYYQLGAVYQALGREKEAQEVFGQVKKRGQGLAKK